MNLCRSHGRDFTLPDYRRFLSAALEISASLARLPTTSGPKQRIFLANAAFTLVAPHFGLPMGAASAEAVPEVTKTTTTTDDSCSPDSKEDDDNCSDETGKNDPARGQQGI